MMRILISCLALLFAGQTLAQEPLPPQPAASVSAAQAPVSSNLDYVLGVADRVRVTVYDEPALSGEYPVNTNGTVSMPLIGEIPAAGVAAGVLRERIEKSLASGFLTNPRVAIDVLTFRPFYILGEVTKAGEYPYSASLTVMNAVATAGGFTYRANEKWVYIKHAGKPGEEKVRLTPDLLVQPGDTIRIAERFF